MKKLIMTSLVLCLAGLPLHAKDEVIKEAGQPDVHEKLLTQYKSEKIAEHTYVIHGPLQFPNPINKGFMNNPGFVISDESVAVIDPGASVQIGRAIIEHVKRKSDKPITHVFNTHVHGDHWLGNQAIKEAYPDVKIYAHPKMIERAEAGDAQQWVDLMMNLTAKATKGTEAVIPDQALQDGQEINVGDLTVTVQLDEHAHTQTDAMFTVVEDKVLFTGDNVTSKRLPRMDDGSFRGSIETIQKSIDEAPLIVVPGHGQTGDIDVLKAYQTYLSTLYESVKLLMDEGMADYEMKPIIVEKLKDFQDWEGFNDEVGKHISLALLEAEQAEFE